MERVRAQSAERVEALRRRRRARRRVARRPSRRVRRARRRERVRQDARCCAASIGSIDPDSGVVRVDGVDVATIDPVQLRRRIGYVPQDGGLLPHWRVQRNVELVLRLERRRRAPSSARAMRSRSSGSTRRASPIAGRANCRADSDSAWRSRARSPPSRRCCCSTSRSARSTRSRDRSFRRRSPRCEQRLRMTSVLVTHDLHEAVLLATHIAVMHRGPHRADARRRRSWSPTPATDYVRTLLQRARVDAAGERRDERARRVGDRRASADDGQSLRRGRSSSRRSRSANRICSPRCSRSCSRRAGCASIDGRDSARRRSRFARCARGAIDVYPEYTGTGLLAILGEAPLGERAAVYRARVEGISDALRRALARAARISEQLCDRRASRDGRFAAPRDAQRSGARRRIAARRAHAGFHRPAPTDFPVCSARTVFASAMCVRSVPAVKYQALAAGAGRRHRRLLDRRTDRAIRPRRAERRPTFLSAVRGCGARERDAWRPTNPRAIAALGELSGRLDEARMRALNERVEVDGDAGRRRRARCAGRARAHRSRVARALDAPIAAARDAGSSAYLASSAVVDRAADGAAHRARGHLAARRDRRSRCRSACVLERVAGARGGRHSRGRRLADASRDRAARVHDSAARHRRRSGARRARPLLALSDRSQHLSPAFAMPIRRPCRRRARSA